MDYNWSIWLNMSRAKLSQMTKISFLPECDKSLDSLVKEEVQVPSLETLKTSLDDRLVTMVVIIVVSSHGIHLIDQGADLEGQIKA